MKNYYIVLWGPMQSAISIHSFSRKIKTLANVLKLTLKLLALKFLFRRKFFMINLTIRQRMQHQLISNTTGKQKEIKAV